MSEETLKIKAPNITRTYKKEREKNKKKLRIT